jgi:ligand-binding sensor domain-containing protein
LLKAGWLNIILIMCFEWGTSQVFPNLRFLHLSDKDGLSNNDVMSFAQDEDGIIWIGTQNGLNRFDGYDFKKFYADGNDPRSIPNSFISSIVPGKKGNLWISASEGVFCFNTRTQAVRSFKSNAADTNTFRKQQRPFIYLDSTQLPWITTRDGIYHFRDSIHYYRTDKGIKAYSHLLKKETNVYCAFVKDGTGQLWCWWDNAIFRVNSITKALIRTYQCPDQIMIRNIFFDSHGRCWVSTWGKGIYLFDPEHNKWQPFSPSKITTVVFGTVEWEVNGKKILVFPYSAPGLFFVDEEDLRTWTFLFDGANIAFSGLPFVDRQNILWIATTDGIYYTAPSNNLFGIIPVPPLTNESGRSMLSVVYNMKEESSGYWVSKRYYGGIFWYDRNWRLLKSWLKIPVGPAIRFPEQGPTSMEGFDFRQAGNEMFVTTEGGISVLNLHTLKWTAYAPGDVRSAPRLRTIVAENDQTWWIRSFDQGVFVFNPVTRQFGKHYRNDDTCRDCMPGFINLLLLDSRQRTFVTTNSGLFSYNKQSDRFDKISITGSPGPTSNLFGLAEDSMGRLWLGAENGLFAFNADTRKIEKAFPENNKIGIVFRICTDNDQNIWFTSNTGYWCWLRKRDKMIHFEYGQGLPRTDQGIFYKTSDGSVYGGGQDAIVRFYPDRLMNYRVGPSTKIIEAVVNDTLAPFSIEAAGNKALNLSPDENSLSVNFDVINYDLISTNQFFYRLRPGNKEWKQTENGHLSFYNLQPGAYRLDVKGSSKLTGNFTNTDSLDIIVNPYWYQSIWFKSACAFLAALLIIYLARYRVSIVRKEGAFLQKIAEIEMTALRAQMNPHFIFNSLNSIENFIMQNEKRLASDYLNKFARLIRMILENSRMASIPLSIDMEAVQLYVDLESLRFNNKFSYTAAIDRILLEGDYKVAPLLIQPFVENAIVHGLAPSDKDGLYLAITVRLRDDAIHYIIEDNGIGRSESMAYAGKNKGSHKSLGLQISRERIEMSNRQHRTDSMLEIADLFDDDGLPAGTRVLLTIKSA